MGNPDTLDQVIDALVELSKATHAVAFEQGDISCRWVGSHDLRHGDHKAFWGALAEGMRCSSAFVRSLYRVSKTIPHDLREQYPDMSWSWWREIIRESGHPTLGLLSVSHIQPLEVVARRLQHMSVRQIQDLRQSRKFGTDRRRFVVTLIGDALKNLLAGNAVTVGSAVPIGHDQQIEVKVTVEVMP